MTERLSHDGAELLSIEDHTAAVHGITIGVFDGPEPSFDDLRDRLESRIALVPRYRQRLVEVPFGLARPIWVDDPHFSLDFHLRHTALPERRSGDALPVLVSRLLSQRLDRGKPLWELWFVSALQDGHWALISKVHYAMVDGVSGTDLFGLLLDDVPAPDTPVPFTPSPLPRPHELIPGAIASTMFNPIEGLRTARALVETPRRLGDDIVDAWIPGRSRSSLGRATGPNRRWQRLRVPLDDVRRARSRHHCTTSDVIIAAITGGLREYLIKLGERVPRRVEALIPLAVASEDTGYAEDVSAVKTSLPVGIADPVMRLETIAAANRIGAQTRGALAGGALRRQDHFAAPTLLALGVRALMLESADLRKAETIVVNVPGPAETSHLLGCELLKAYPVIPLVGRVRMSFAVMSYRDELGFGITADWDTSPDIHLLAEAIQASVDELL